MTDAWILPGRDAALPAGWDAGRLEIVGPKTSVLADAREHARPKLVAFMEGEHVIRPPLARQDSMGADLPLDCPSDALKRS
jgi:hypothetical protein